nr:alpha-mannosidase [Saccharolobus solfataricus]
MVSGESLARQFLYSQRFYLKILGSLLIFYGYPTHLGFQHSLPQIAKLGGVKAFATHKVFWNDTNKFPYNVFKWVGPNGDYLPAIAFGHGKGGYNSDFSASSVLEQYNNWAQKDQPMLYSYGYGDGGGGPNEDMLIRAEAVNLLPILPKVELSGVNSYIQRIVPVEEWRGELYLETHRGVLTSHSKMKLLNRSAEIALREAELWSTLARTYDKEVFTKLWKVVLKDQFHDVLPGSAIKDVYKVAYQELEEVINKANNVASEAMQKLVGGSGDKTFVFNSLSWDREEYIEADGKLVKVRVPSVGFSLLEPVEVRDKAVINENNAEYLVENKYFRVRISKSGQVLSLFDKEANREVLRDKSNLLIAYENIPGWADAWDIEKGFEDRSFEIRASSSEIVNNDGIVASIKFTYKFRRSEIIQIVRVYADSRRIDFITTLRMRDRELLVKSWFNFDLNVERAVSDIPFGVVERFTWSNTSWDKARFEVPIQKFVDFSESEYGAALLNNGKYGATLRGSSVGLSLTKTPIYPDPSTDLEEVTFIYSLYPHIGDWKRAEVIKRAYELNVPLRVVKGVSEVKRKSFIRINDSKLILEAVKVAEDDNNSVVLRLYEYENTRGEAYVEVPFNVTEARSLDLLELNEVPRDIVIEGNRIKVKYKNRDILTISVSG